MGAAVLRGRLVPMSPLQVRARSRPSRSGEADLLSVVDQVAALLPGLPRLQLLDVVDAEWARLCAAAEPMMAAFVVPAAVLRLRAGVDSVTSAV